ncbi:hypothetical protein HU200_044914 [Digitaria exilis]|uniref:Bifunctional inhibitor/plant lipid transfer protein/seed storage helical domain-containing protein n=1 Tax=Digitaria exilis TaxID=1010633 RepID=A0A835BCU6_9POAL|nr:hypothetical protein HU200_044914 [Digitaria exilis]CAB3496078.1 unnamed protein product [Digitaria exilis]
MMQPAAALVLLALASALSPHPPGARAQQISAAPLGAPSPSSLDCGGALRNLTPCLTYVERRSALTRPDKGCCGALAAVVGGGDEAACLCALLGGYGVVGVRVDPVRALALPTICRVDAPPPRLCAALGMPVAEPPGGAAASPMDSGSDVPTTPPATAAANGGPATQRRLFLAALPHFCIVVILATLLL